MLDRFQTQPFDPAPLSAPPLARLFTPLPDFLAKHFLRPGEQVTFVRGPSWNPTFEPYLTHPLQFAAALAFAAVCIGLGRLAADSWGTMHPTPFFLGVGVALLSIYVLAFFNGYFTRLIVTNERLMIVQGFEVRRSWGIDALPRSLLRHDPRGDSASSKTIDLEAVQSMLGGSSTGFTDAKTIRTFGKQVAQIRKDEKGRD